jgi:hypothetical protein
MRNRKKPGFSAKSLYPTCPYIETRFLGTAATNQETSGYLCNQPRNRVSLRNVCLPTRTYIETRFLENPCKTKKPGFYESCWLVAKVVQRNPVSQVSSSSSITALRSRIKRFRSWSVSKSVSQFSPDPTTCSAKAFLLSIKS